ncbi:MAG: HAD family phosphatase [Thermomicrobiales bacterium]
MTRPAAIEALIFDMDGTLVDSEPFAARAWADWLGQHGHTLRDEVLGQMYGLRLLEGAAVIRREYGIVLPVEEIAHAQDSLRIAALRGNLKPLPGADVVLAAGRAAGLRLALATSSLRHHADLSLAETAMAGLFDAEVTGEEVERGKPAPDIFLLAAERLGASPSACVVFEDSPAGVTAALAATMRCLWIPGPAHAALDLDPPPTARLENLGEAIAWLAGAGVVLPGIGA